MKRARGFTGIEIIGILVAAAALVGAIVGAIHVVTTFIENTEREGYDRGVQTTDAAYKARDNAKLQALNARIVQLQGERDALEAKLRAKTFEAAGLAKRLKENADAEATATLADLDAGALVLRDGVVEIARGCPAGRGADAAGAPGAAAGVAPCKPLYRLSRAAEESLVGIARDGQRASANLAGCIAKSDADVALINGP